MRYTNVCALVAFATTVLAMPTSDPKPAGELTESHHGGEKCVCVHDMCKHLETGSHHDESFSKFGKSFCDSLKEWCKKKENCESKKCGGPGRKHDEKPSAKVESASKPGYGAKPSEEAKPASKPGYGAKPSEEAKPASKPGYGAKPSEEAKPAPSKPGYGVKPSEEAKPAPSKPGYGAPPVKAEATKTTEAPKPTKAGYGAPPAEKPAAKPTTSAAPPPPPPPPADEGGYGSDDGGY